MLAQTEIHTSEDIFISQGSQLFVINVFSTYVSYLGPGCPDAQVPGGCQGQYHLSISGPGVNYDESLGGSLLSPPSGTGWDPPQFFPGSDGPVVLSAGNVYHRETIRAFDVTSAAQNQAIVLHLTYDQTGIGVLVNNPYNLHTTAGLFLSQTPTTFRPLDARDATRPGGDVNVCNGNDQGGNPREDDCHPKFNVGFYMAFNGHSEAAETMKPLAALNPVITLTLAQGLKPDRTRRPWLAGSSTNFGADTVDVPDYVFEGGVLNPTLPAPSADGLSIANIPVTIDNALAASIPFKVTSRDYGGSATLTATVTIAGLPNPIYARVYNADVSAVRPDCSPDFATKPFASLPVDQDCNGIADSWEGKYTTPAGGHLVPADDKEPGHAPTSPVGDRYSVHDEYRGFHFVLDDGTTVKWASTDPVNKKDVFFWDETNHYTIPLRAILARQGTETERSASDFKIIYRRVTALQANAPQRRNPVRGAELLNRNSQTLAAQRGFAVVYAEKSLNQIRAASTGTYTLTLGKSPSIHNDGWAVFIDPVAISSFLSRPGNSIFPLATLTAEVVAHETGHHFGQLHPRRNPCCTFTPLETKSQLPNLTMSQYAFLNVQPDGNGRIRSDKTYMRLTQYPFSNRLEDADDLSSEGVTMVSGTTGRSRTIEGAGVSSKKVAVADSTGSPSVFEITLDRKLDSTETVIVQNQLKKLMDWAPNLTLTDVDQWGFDPALNLERLCMRMVCP